MKQRVVGLTVALLLTMAGTLSAQLIDLPGGAFSSPQSDATQGRIRSMTDDALRPDAYRNVQFENWFGLTSFSNLFDAKAMLGFATKLGDTYFSTFYRGSFWEHVPNPSYVKTGFDFAGGVKAFPIYDTVFDMEGYQPNNTIGVLIGTGDMGFRIAFNSRLRSFNEDDIGVGSTGTALYKNYEQVTGNLHPQLVWSMAKNLTSKGIRPYAGVEVIFANYYKKYEQYNPETGRTYGQEVVSSRNYIEPRFTAGLGSYTLHTYNGFTLSTDIEYQLRLHIIENEFSYFDGSTNKVAKINGYNTSGDLTENTYTYNRLIPSLAGAWTGDTLALRFQLRLLAELSYEEETAMDGSSGTLVKTGAYNNVTTLSLNPQLRLAARWSVNPQLALNVGGLINVEPMIYAYTDGDNYTAQDNIFGGVSTQLTLGATFNFTKNFSLEATCGVDGTSNRVNVLSTTTGGLLNFGNILASLRF